MHKLDATVPSNKSWPYRVEFFPQDKPFGRKQSRKFRTQAEAIDFISEKHDEGCDTYAFGPEWPEGTTWNGSSRF